MILHTASDKSEERNPNGFIAKIRQSLEKDGDKVDTAKLWAQLKPILTFSE